MGKNSIIFCVFFLPERHKSLFLPKTKPLLIGLNTWYENSQGFITIWLSQTSDICFAKISCFWNGFSLNNVSFLSPFLLHWSQNSKPLGEVTSWHSPYLSSQYKGISNYISIFCHVFFFWLFRVRLVLKL